MSIPHVPVQQIIRNIGGGPVQPFRINRPFSHIEIVCEKFIVVNRCLPMKLFANFSPEFLRVVD